MASGAEGVLVRAGDGVRSGGPGNVENLVLCCLLHELQRDPRGGGSRQDLVVLADQFLGDGNCFVRISAIIVIGDIQFGVADLVRAFGGVVQAGLQPLVVGVPVGG